MELQEKDHPSSTNCCEKQLIGLEHMLLRVTAEVGLSMGTVIR